MDIPRHVLHTLFTDTQFPLIQHHVDSFNDMLDNGIPTFVGVTPFELEVRDNRLIRVHIGGKDGRKLYMTPPTEDDGTPIVPHACRLDNKTYALNLRADIDIDYVFPDKTTETRSFANVRIGEIPLMLRSRLCYLSAMDGYEIGECKYEPGGYFIIDGAEKVLLTQELLGNNMFYAGMRKRKPQQSGTKGLVERESPYDLEYTIAATDEFYTGIRTLSEDGSRGPYSHFLTLPDYGGDVKGEDDDDFSKRSQAAIRTPPPFLNVTGFQQPVPLLSVFRALGVSSDRDLYDYVLVGVPDKDRNAYDGLFQHVILSHEEFLRNQEATDLELLAKQTRNKSKSEVVVMMHETLFSHVESGAFRRKAYLLGHMLKMAMDVALGRRPPSDRDNMQFKRLKTSGVLMFEEFKRLYREAGREMLSRMDRKVTFNAGAYAGKELVNLVDAETVGYYWKGYHMLNQYLKSFKGSWGGRVGVAQELARPSYMAVLHHLRKTDLQIDKSASTAPPRRLYASQFGLMCPVDSPDGSDIGYKKALAIFARVTNAFPSETIKALLLKTGLVRDANEIHPSTWKPEWTPIFLNSSLVGACIGDTEDLHQRMRAARRAGDLAAGVTLAWNRLNNLYTIYSDAGRPIRPVYREGTDPEEVRKAKTWAAIANHLDYIDASETDSLRLSLVPFHPTQPSELHMSFNMSAIANLVPYPDHNAGPRNMFSIAQQKQAASWYHTNYKKRFDTIAMIASLPQKPLSHTWMYNEIMGRGGCMPYGENAIVAVTMYGGHNQEDSVIVNGGALKRGMYQTMYSHSYDIVEDVLDPALQTQTQIMNPLTNDSIKRQEGMDYSMLDGDGIIRVNSIVDTNTVLVGMVSPVTNASGQTVGHRDISVKPKRGQHGRVDAVYRFSTQAGTTFEEGERVPIYVRGVKIRIVEERIPVVGDKMASRHSQKGTIGQILPEEDMPFTGSGRRPDILFNPHGIPTRMTVGQFVEAASNKLGLELGTFVDATPFSTTNRIGDLRMALLQRGFHPYGSEVLYNGQTGEMMEADIFMGPIYYQRLKHMVEDKINYRTTGPKKLLTRQPTQGRGDEGGLRIGEMERDALVSHGMSKFLTESMMERSDKATIQFDHESGQFATSRDMLDVPYAAALYTQELEAMHIDVQIKTE